MSVQCSHIIDEIDGFKLVGSSKAHDWCGIWQTFGCLNHKKAYIRQFKRTCFRSECKVCYFAWASRQANRAVKKLNKMKRNNTLHHTVLTIPNTWNKQTKQRLIIQLKKIGIESACIIHTPFDESNNYRFYLKNTLHIFYYGKMVNLYSLGDCTITRLVDPNIDELFRILQTQFLNCGVKKGTHPVSWIGKSKYCTLEIQNHSIDGRNCPLCNKKLHLIYFDGSYCPIPPDISFNGETEKSDWRYCFRESIWRRMVRIIQRKTKSMYHYFGKYVLPKVSLPNLLN